MPILDDEQALAALIPTLRTVAVVGMKGEDQADQAAYQIPALLQRLGVRVIPVNPKLTETLGEKAYARLADVPERADCIDVFRRPSVIPELADQILALPPARRPAGVWLQSGIRHAEAAARLSDAGLWVVEDRCLGVYARRYHDRRAIPAQ